MANAAILLAGGSSRRMQGYTDDKILLPLAGKPVFQHSLDTFLLSGVVSIIVIIHRDEKHKDTLLSLLPESSSTQFLFVPGGEERMHSVYNGLEALEALAPEIVFIHDTARPLISIKLLKSLLDAAEKYHAACPATRVTDTLKRANSKVPASLEPVSRDNLWALQTPQTFQYPLIREAYQQALNDHLQLTDDTSAFAEQGGKVHLIENPAPNPKLTTPADLSLLEYLLQPSG
jgi:2-C-methyl-D-erythritol 4-phosphate cytidylyltransferase